MGYKLSGKYQELTVPLLAGWQKRWLEITDDYLLYYKKSSDTKEAGKILLADVINISCDVEEITEKENSFVVLIQNRDYYFYTQSPQERDKFVEIIENSIPGCSVNDSKEISLCVSLRDDDGCRHGHRERV